MKVVVKRNVVLTWVLASILAGFSTHSFSETTSNGPHESGPAVEERQKAPATIKLIEEYAELKAINTTLNVKEAVTGIDGKKQTFKLLQAEVPTWTNFITSSEKIRESLGVCATKGDASANLMAEMMDNHFRFLHAKIFQGKTPLSANNATNISEKVIVTYDAQTKRLFKTMEEEFTSEADKKSLAEVKKTYIAALTAASKLFWRNSDGIGIFRGAQFDQAAALKSEETKNIVNDADTIEKEIKDRSTNNKDLCAFTEKQETKDDPGKAKEETGKGKEGDKGSSRPDITAGPLQGTNPPPQTPPQQPPQTPPQQPPQTPPLDPQAPPFNDDQALQPFLDQLAQKAKELADEEDKLKDLANDIADLARQNNAQNDNIADKLQDIAKAQEQAAQQATPPAIPSLPAASPDTGSGDNNKATDDIPEAKEPKEEKTPAYGGTPVNPPEFKITADGDKYKKEALPPPPPRPPQIDPALKARLDAMEFQMQLMAAAQNKGRAIKKGTTNSQRFATKSRKKKRSKKAKGAIGEGPIGSGNGKPSSAIRGKLGTIKN